MEEGEGGGGGEGGNTRVQRGWNSSDMIRENDALMPRAFKSGTTQGRSGSSGHPILACCLSVLPFFSAPQGKHFRAAGRYRDTSGNPRTQATSVH